MARFILRHRVYTRGNWIHFDYISKFSALTGFAFSFHFAKSPERFLALIKHRHH